MKLWEACTLAEKVERWENAERVLKNLSPHERRKHFYMGLWGQRTDCGTVACAAGHCGLDPWFRRRGFQLNFRVGHDAFNKEEWISDISDAGAFFGSIGTCDIFMNTAHRPVSTVIKEIQAYIRQLKEQGS